MPCISGQYDPVVGVLLQVAVLPGGHLNEAIQSNSEESPTPLPQDYVRSKRLLDQWIPATSYRPSAGGILAMTVPRPAPTG